MTILWSFSYNSFVKFHNKEKLRRENLLYPNLCYNEVCCKGTVLDMLYPMNVMSPIFIVNYKFHAILYMPFLLISFLFFFCPPPFRRKAEGHSFRHSVLPSFRPPNIVGTLCAQLLLQFYADSFETLQMF